MWLAEICARRIKVGTVADPTFLKLETLFLFEMRDFFDGPRQVAGFHILICYINVFSKPHKGFRLRRTLGYVEG